VFERFDCQAGLGIVDMLADRIVERVAARLAEVLAPPSRPLVPFIVDGHAAGYLEARRAARLASFDEVFATNEGSIAFHRSLATATARTEALAGVTRTLAAEGALTRWRDERYRVPSSAAAPALFEIERAAARYFGIETQAAHVNGTTVRRDGTTGMWVARRSAAKPIDPGLLDNLVGGGVAAGLSVLETVAKEAREEAGIPPSLARLARPSGTVAIVREQPDGLQRETLHVYDLELPPAFTPRNDDGEVVDFRLASVDEVAEWIGDRDGPRVVTADASLVVVDWLLRHGHVTPAHAAFAALDALRVATLPPNAP
jgi:8-oxo-dGTP pyrophosphatase MutT (NUDIX family)